MGWMPPFYRLATKNLPRVHTDNLVYRGGRQLAPTTPLVGGGNIVPKTWSGRFRPVVLGHGVVNLGIQGVFVARPFGTGPLANSPDIIGYSPTGSTSSSDF